MLREYQQRAINQLYAWFEAGHEGNPCLVLPTGAGKSHIVAALCKDALQNWPETRVLMLTHQKELIEQNSEKMRQHWPNAPLGIYSASLGRRQLGEPITFAGIQSVSKKADMLGHVDLCIIDECHLVNHNDEGGYRSLLAALKAINPNLRVIGLTATPYRLGHGLITDDPALFDDLIQPVSIEELVQKGFLSTLRSKVTRQRLSVEGVHKRGGDYIESELQQAVNRTDINTSIVQEVIRYAGDRKSWLFFCAGVLHAEAVAEELQASGIHAECVTGATSKTERERILQEFKSGRIQALTNANILTTGFDAPNIDLIALLRPTMSPGLYVQMAGRGLRLKEHTDHCLVLDFAGAVETHGPITNVQPPKRKGDGDGEAPIKVCDACHEICHASVKACPACGAPFPEPVKAPLELRTNDIMGQGDDLMVETWIWRKHTSRASGKEILTVTYYGALSDKPVSEYICVTHDGYAGTKARALLATLARQSDAPLDYGSADLDDMASQMMQGKPPNTITYRKEGKFYNVTARTYTE